MFRFDRAAAHIHGGADDAVRRQVRHPVGGAGEVHQRVQRTEFVEVHRLGGLAVDLSLRLEDPPEEAGGGFPGVRGEGAPVQHRQELGEAAVPPVVRGGHGERFAAEPAARSLPGGEGHRRAEGGDHLPQALLGVAEVEETAEEHVAGQAGGAVHEQDAQGRRILGSASRRRGAGLRVGRRRGRGGGAGEGGWHPTIPGRRRRGAGIISLPDDSAPAGRRPAFFGVPSPVPLETTPAAADAAQATREEAFERLRAFTQENGLKKSRQRELILERFLGMGGHVSADDLHAEVRTADSGVGRTTVYRALRLFCEAGIASSIDLKDGLTRFEPELSREHHDHLVCIECGRIDEFLSPEIETKQDEVAAEYGYRLVSHRHQLYGVCPDCGNAADD